MAEQDTTVDRHSEAVQPKSKRSCNARRIRREATTTFLEAVPEVVRAIIEQAKSGGYSQQNLVLKMAGVTEPVEAEPNNPAESSLAALLLRRLDALTCTPEEAEVLYRGAAEESRNQVHAADTNHTG